MAHQAPSIRTSNWRANAITLPDDEGRTRQGPAVYLRCEFGIDASVRRARLDVTSLGVHEIRINGQRVGDDLLSPGWTSYHQRLLVDTHDVTGLLRPGPNAIGGILGDGWYRGRLGWGADDRCRYGNDVALILQLEVDLADGRRITLSSDSSWRASTAEIRQADLYDGSTIDLRLRQPGWDRVGFNDAAWLPASIVPFDPRVIEPRSAAPVRVIETLRPTLTHASDGTIRVDSGQNLAGFLRLRVRGRSGDQINVRHAEVLEPDGGLHTRALRSARATDEYILADGDEVVLEPSFTFHGFRYAEIATSAEVLNVEVIAISSDLPQRSEFSCSDDRLNQLHANVLWSLRGNFVSIPTDCPQRDERLGWTGDAQAFAPTACTLVESEAFWQSWLRDLELDQDDEFGVPSVVPDVVLEGEARFGRAGWADAATIVPWAVYESFGDPGILRLQFSSMRRWVDSLVRRQDSDGLLRESWQFGDWLDPDAPPDRPWEAKADGQYIANAFFAHSARLLADAATVLGNAAVATEYGELAARVASATWRRWSDHALTTQTGCAIALRLGIAPSDRSAEVVDTLERLVDDADGRVATGFLGTPLVLPALADAGRFEAAYRMLLRTESPSWLYQLAQGATTVWERWDAIRPDGSIHPGTMAPMTPDGEEGHMLSFNHYAYGAVIDWVYRHVAGIAPDRSEPGYKRIIFAPRPAAGIEWAKASINTPFGRAAIAWRVEADQLVADVELPTGTNGVFDPPSTNGSTMTVDRVAVEAAGPVELSAGRHVVKVTAADIVGSAGRTVLVLTPRPAV